MTQTDDNTAEAAPAGAVDAKPASELDSLLSEFKNATNNTKELDPVIEFAKGEMARKQQESLDGDIAKAVEVIQKADDALKGVNPKLIQGLMEAYAREDPGFAKAFEDRGKNPKGWEAALVEGSKFALDLLNDLPGNKGRDDLEAAKAAVDGTSTDSTPKDDEPDIAEIQKLSDFDFKQRLQEEIAKAAR